MTATNAKFKLLSNTGSNILDAVITAVIGLYLTPYLVRNLGVEVYGLIPLVTSVVAYYSLLTGGLSASVGRFVGYHLNRGEHAEGNRYFNSALFPMMALCAGLGVVVILIGRFFPNLFNVPAGYESEASILFATIGLGTLMAPISGIFMVSTFITHRFDLLSFSRIFSKLLRLAFILLAFAYLGPKLTWIGLAYILMTVSLLIASVAYTRRLTPTLGLNPRLTDKSAIVDMAGMSFWLLIHRLMALLYVNTSVIIINLMLGSEACGRFGAINQWGVLLITFSTAISTVFGPIALEMVAKEKIDDLANHTRNATRYMGLILALPAGLLCGLAHPLLSWWLGPEFIDLVPLLVLIVAPKVLNLSVSPMFAVRGSMNKVKVPALVGLSGAVVNIGLGILLVKFTGLGILGVALASFISLSAVSFFFAPAYNAAILGKPRLPFYLAMLPGILMFLVIALATYGTSRLVNLASLTRLLAVGLSAGIVYVVVCYGLVLSGKDRAFFRSLISRKAA